MKRTRGQPPSDFSANHHLRNPVIAPLFPLLLLPLLKQSTADSRQAMSPAPGSQFFMALELGLAWAGFLPLLPLLTAPRRDNGEEAPSTFPRLACAAAATTGAVAAASVLRARARSSNSGGGGGRRSEGAIIVRMVARGIAGLLVGTIAIHATSVVLGAPVLRKFPETFAFSVLMAALTSLPVSVSSPQPLQACAGFLRRTRPPVYEEGAMVPAAGCAIGAWLGAIPLCLDWEQPWQDWPLPMCVGGLLGFSAGFVVLLGMSLVEKTRRYFVSRLDWPAKRS